MRGLSSRQFVTIVVSICAAAVLLPTAVWAATATLVKLSGASGNIAQVDSSGHLLVTDGGGAMTVDGTVTAVPRPSRPWDTINGVPIREGVNGLVYAGVGGQGKLNITSFYAANLSGSPVQINMLVYVASAADANCYTRSGNFAAAERFVIEVPAYDTITLTYPTPLSLSAYAQTGDPYCVEVSGSGAGGWSANIGASGFISP